jgi:hypothetical protein
LIFRSRFCMWERTCYICLSELNSFFCKQHNFILLYGEYFFLGNMYLFTYTIFSLSIHLLIDT